MNSSDIVECASRSSDYAESKVLDVAINFLVAIIAAFLASILQYYYNRKVSNVAFAPKWFGEPPSCSADYRSRNERCERQLPQVLLEAIKNSNHSSKVLVSGRSGYGKSWLVAHRIFHHVKFLKKAKVGLLIWFSMKRFHTNDDDTEFDRVAFIEFIRHDVLAVLGIEIANEYTSNAVHILNKLETHRAGNIARNNNSKRSIFIFDDVDGQPMMDYVLNEIIPRFNETLHVIISNDQSLETNFSPRQIVRLPRLPSCIAPNEPSVIRNQLTDQSLVDLLGWILILPVGSTFSANDIKEILYEYRGQEVHLNRQLQTLATKGCLQKVESQTTSKYQVVTEFYEWAKESFSRTNDVSNIALANLHRLLFELLQTNAAIHEHHPTVLHCLAERINTQIGLFRKIVRVMETHKQSRELITTLCFSRSCEHQHASPLHLLLREGRQSRNHECIEIACQLLDSMLQTNMEDTQGKMYFVVYGNNGETIAAMLIRSFNQTDWKLNAFMVAAAYEHNYLFLSLKQIIMEYNVGPILGDNNNTTLHIAAAKGASSLIKNLTFELNACNASGQTPLMLAIRKRRYHTARKLLEFDDVDMRALDNNGNSLAIIAAGCAYERGLELLHEFGQLRKIDVFSSSNFNNETALMKAALRGNCKCVEFLLHNGVKLSATEAYLLRPLCKNVVEQPQQDFDIVELEEKIAQLYVPNQQNMDQTRLGPKIMGSILADSALRNDDMHEMSGYQRHFAMLIAVHFGKAKTLQSFLAHSAINSNGKRSMTPLMIAALTGHFECFNMLIARSDVTLRCEDGLTALHYAALPNGCREMVDALKRMNPDILEARTFHGSTALMIAARSGNATVLRALLDNGADANATKRFGYTALLMAAKFNQLETMRTLLERRQAHMINVDHRNQGGATALIMASELGNVEMVQLLQNNGADINRRQNAGWTALMKAAENGCVDVANFLIDNGCDVNAQQRMGLTALHIAAMNGHQQVMECLQKARANVEIKNWNGRTARELAEEAKNNDKNIADLLPPCN